MSIRRPQRVADLVPLGVVGRKNGIFGNSGAAQQWFKMVEPPGGRAMIAGRPSPSRIGCSISAIGMKDKDGKFLFAVADNRAQAPI